MQCESQKEICWKYKTMQQAVVLHFLVQTPQGALQEHFNEDKESLMKYATVKN